MLQPISPRSSRSNYSSSDLFFSDASIKYNASRDSTAPTVPTLDMSAILYLEPHAPIIKSQPIRHMIQSPRPKPVVKNIPQHTTSLGCLNFFRRLLPFNNNPSRNAVVPLSDNRSHEIG